MSTSRRRRQRNRHHKTQSHARSDPPSRASSHRTAESQFVIDKNSTTESGAATEQRPVIGQPPGLGPDDPFRPVARTAADVLAIIPHTLGYWPRHSVVVQTATTHGLGPCLRIDLPGPEEFRDPETVAAWTTQFAALLEHDPVGDRMFVVIYGDPGVMDPDEAARDHSAPVNAAGENTAAGTVDEKTRPRGHHGQRRVLHDHAVTVLDAVEEAGMLSGHGLYDAWCVAEGRWWALTSPGTERPVRDITDSAVYAALVCDGSVIGPDPSAACSEGDPQSYPEGHTGSRTEGCSVMPISGAAGLDDPDGDQWRPTYLERWDHVLRVAVDCETLSDSRAVTELILGLMDPLGADIVLAVALTGDLGASRAAWSEWLGVEGQEPQSPFEPEGLLHVARVMLGEWDGRPEWDRVNRCAEIIETLLRRFGGAQATWTAPVPVNGDADPASVRGASVLADLWLALAHIERFRARGSRSAMCAARAEDLAPWHPGIARLRGLATNLPIPVWAANPETAWRRDR